MDVYIKGSDYYSRRMFKSPYRLFWPTVSFVLRVSTLVHSLPSLRRRNPARIYFYCPAHVIPRERWLVHAADRHTHTYVCTYVRRRIIDTHTHTFYSHVRRILLYYYHYVVTVNYNNKETDFSFNGNLKHLWLFNKLNFSEQILSVIDRIRLWG